MNIRRTRAILWLTTLALTAGAGVAIALHLANPPALSATNTSDNSDGSSHATASAALAAAPDAAELRQVASRDYRKQLFDPPKVEPKPPPPKPLPPIELISTILRAEGDASAWIKDGQATRKVMVGDTVGPADNPATITAIEAQRLVLEHEGRSVDVPRQAEGGRR